MKQDKIIKLFFSILLTITLGYFLLRQIKLQDILTVLLSIPLDILAIGFLVYFSLYVIRAIRFRMLLGKISFKELFKIVCLHNMFNGLLPFRTGELSFIYLVSKKGEKKEKATSSLLISRFFDFVMIAIFFIIMLLLSGTKEKSLIVSSLMFFAAILISLGGIVLSGFFFRNIKRFAAKLPLLMKAVSFAEEVIDNLKHIGARKSLEILFISLILWIADYFFIYLVVSAMGINLSLYSMIMAITFTILITTLPIHGLLSFGTMETGWVISFMLFNVEKSLAISSGFAFHILNIVFFMIMGVIGLVSYAKFLFRNK